MFITRLCVSPWKHHHFSLWHQHIILQQFEQSYTYLKWRNLVNGPPKPGPRYVQPLLSAINNLVCHEKNDVDTDVDHYINNSDSAS